MITEEQRKERMNGIGGSDIPVILGLSNYKTPYQLYLEKCGFIKDDMKEDNVRYWGHKLESVIIEEFSKRNNIKVYQSSIDSDPVIYPEFPFLRGNIDGWIGEWQSVLEVKTSCQFLSNRWGESGSDTIPLSYLSQVAFYRMLASVGMYGGSSDKAHIAVLIGGNDYREYIYNKDEILENHILESAIKFWECVQNKIPPEAINQIDLKLMFPRHSPEKTIKITDDLKKDIENISNIKILQKKQSKIEEESKFNIMKFMGDAECLINEEGISLVTWKTNKNGSRVFLWKEI